MLHADSDGLVELAAGARRRGNLAISTRNRPDHFLPGGSTGQGDWLDRLLALADSRANRGEEVFAAPTVRREPRGDKHAVAHTRALWVDVDQPGRLPALWAFLAARPCHLLIETGGSGGAHAYRTLDEALPATQSLDNGEVVELIERARLRLIHHLGTGPDGKPDVADLACFPAGTFVLTDGGYRAIETLTEGDRVLTHLGRWRQSPERWRARPTR